MKKRSNKRIFTDDELIAKNICPDCWDGKGYYNEYLNFVEDRTKTDLHGPSSSSNKAFIEQYVQDNITGIELKNDHNRHYCPSCHKEYMQEPGEVDGQDPPAEEI